MTKKLMKKQGRLYIKKVASFMNRFLHAVKLPAYMRKYSQIHEHKTHRRSLERNGSSVFEDENSSIKKILPTEITEKSNQVM